MVAIRSFMDSEAKGQLGGLDCEEAVRKRMAAESAKWKCAACGKANGEIMKECEEAVAEAEKDGKGTKLGKEEEVPAELRLAYKDELGKEGGSKESDRSGSKGSQGDQVSKASSSQATSSGTAIGTSEALSPVGARNTSQVTRPPPPTNRTTPRPTTTTATLPPRPQPMSDQGVPGWVDKAICGVVACLVIMILRKVFYI